MSTRQFRVETTVEILDGDWEAIALYDEWAAGRPNRMHRRLASFSDAGWGLGKLVSCDVMLHRTWWDGEIAAGDADEERGHHRAVVMLVDPAHEQIDMLEPCPPRKDGDSVLTSAGRLAWYREHRSE